MSLIKITQNIINIENQILDNDGVLSEELESFLTISQNNLATKIDDYSYLIDRLEKSIELFKAKKEEAARAQKSYENIIDTMKERLKFAMSEMNTSELSGNEYKYKLARSKSKIKVIDESVIPIDFIREKVTYEVDKEKIYNALENGVHIDGVILEETQSLRKSILK